MKLQLLCVAAVALIQSAFVASHEVPSFRGVLSLLLDDAEDATDPAKADAPGRKDGFAGETLEELRRLDLGENSSTGTLPDDFHFPSRRWNGGCAEKRAGKEDAWQNRFQRCVNKCGGGSRCRRHCGLSEDAILDLFEFTGGFSVMPDDEDFEALDYGK